jgi:insertion element IS1 protein InsB
MKCPRCDSTQTVKNGHRKDRQCYRCKQCDRQFLEFYRPWQYSERIKLQCLDLYIDGIGVRAIERLTNIHHTTILGWIRQAGLEPVNRSKLKKLLN